MAEKVKIGVRIDEQVWEDFRSYVQETRNRSRGVLGEEVEIALEERMYGENQSDTMARIEDDVATIKAMLAESDGGTVPTPSNEDVHTHTPNEKPAANAPRKDKIEWIVENHMSNEQATEDLIRQKVREEFGFEDRTLDKYTTGVLKYLGAKKHPVHENFYVWGEKLEEAKERAREKREQEAKDDVQEVME